MRHDRRIGIPVTGPVPQGGGDIAIALAREATQRPIDERAKRRVVGRDASGATPIFIIGRPSVDGAFVRDEVVAGPVWHVPCRSALYGGRAEGPESRHRDPGGIAEPRDQTSGEKQVDLPRREPVSGDECLTPRDIPNRDLGA